MDERRAASARRDGRPVRRALARGPRDVRDPDVDLVGGERAMSTTSGRPRVICHMMMSVDGRIATEGWPLSTEGRRQYELVHETFAPDAWICGRVTMEQHF